MEDEFKKQLVGFNYDGSVFKLANYWFSMLPPAEYNNRPIKYLEIGAFHGGNICSVANTYASHPKSELWAIDPWMDYGDYPEYKNKQDVNYSIYLSNIEKSPHKDKIHHKRGFSNNEVLKFEDEYFDIIYIDGNHEPEFVLEDAVLCFRKLKTGGILIFDDYTWGGPDMTQRGIDGFMHGYHKRIQILGCFADQVYVRKTKSYDS